MLRFNFNPFFSPEEVSGGNTGELSVNEMIDALGNDDDKEDILDINKDDKEIKDEKKPAKEEAESDKEGDEDIEITEDEEEPEEIIDEEVVEDVPRKEILKVYPDLFKKFPQLERAYYREQKYAELLPTIEDAQTAVDKAETFDKYSEAILQGNIGVVLDSLKQNNEQGFAKVVDNYLPLLSKIDQNAYYHVIGNVVKNTISAMVSEGDRIQNDQLKAAAIILNQFIFGSSEYSPPGKFGREQQDNEETTKLKNERQELIRERYNSSFDDLSTKTNNAIKSTISQYIDPKNVMTDYVKRTAIREAVSEVDSLIAKDARFKATLDKLWARAFQQNFNRESTDTIKRAYLSKAKTLLPSIIQKHRNEALKGLGKRVTEDREEVEKKGPVSRGAPTSANNRSNEKSVPAGMKTLDYLMQD